MRSKNALSWRMYTGLVACSSLLASASCGDVTGPNERTIIAVDSTSLSIYWTHACGLDTSGTAWCWGNNWRGELGDGTTTTSDVPVRVLGGHTFTSISVSGWTSCGIDTEGVAWCWGDNQYGQLGAGWHAEAAYSALPQRVLVQDRLVQISAGGLQTCALTTAGVAYCWGSNHRGAIGIGRPDPQVVNTPVRVPTRVRFRSISSGRYGVCGVAINGVGYCWGAPGTFAVSSSAPSPVPGDQRWHFIYANQGDGPLCGVTESRVPLCWGLFAFKGGGSSSPVTTIRNAGVPEDFGAPDGVAKMSGLCLNYEGGTARCMNFFYVNQTEGEVSWEARAVPDTPSFSSVTGTIMAKCGVTAEREMYCWIRNEPPSKVAGDIAWRVQ